MKRRLINLLAVMSLLLFVAVVGMWVRSYFAYDLVVYDFSDEAPGGEIMGVESSGGEMAFSYVVHLITRRPPGFHWAATDPSPFGQTSGWRMFVFERGDNSGLRYWIVYFPQWLLALLSAVLPAMWLIGWVRRRPLKRSGACSSCGYDLRASPERCPECGRPVDATAGAADAPSPA